MMNDKEEGPLLKPKKQNFTNSVPMIVMPPHRARDLCKLIHCEGENTTCYIRTCKLLILDNSTPEI